MEAVPLRRKFPDFFSKKSGQNHDLFWKCPDIFRKCPDNSGTNPENLRKFPEISGNFRKNPEKQTLPEISRKKRKKCGNQSGNKGAGNRFPAALFPLFLFALSAHTFRIFNSFKNDSIPFFCPSQLLMFFLEDQLLLS